jgi:hypothetical protein
MAFVILYREIHSPKNESACIVGSEQQVRETLLRLGRDGYEVTRITPRLGVPEGISASPKK